MRIQFQTWAQKVGSWTLVVLPAEASEQLPSRGMCMAEGEINGAPFQAPLEPDGRGGHWFRLTDSLRKAAKAQVGSTLAICIEATDNWPDPTLPSDLEEALAADSGARETWTNTTSKARWDWLRWIRSTNNEQTRRGRIEKACSKLSAGNRRPCCFDRNRCTEPDVSSNGRLRNSD